MRPAIIGMCVALAACSTSQQRLDEAWQRDMQQCIQAGFPMGTLEYKECLTQKYASDQAAEAARMQRAADLWAQGTKTLSTPPPLPPQFPVVCRQTYYGTVCQ